MGKVYVKGRKAGAKRLAEMMGWELPMRSLIMILFVLFTMSGTLLAEPVVLKCVTNDGEDAADLVVDLEKRELRWSSLTYDIININDKYISAYLRPDFTVGGEIWVIDRRSGEYKRGAVYIPFNPLGPEQERLKATTFSGRCIKPQF